MAFSNEHILLNRIATGDTKAFQKLHELYHDTIYRFIYKFVKSTDLTNDICQEVFIKIWVDRHSIREVSSFSAYLFTVTRNYTLNVLKRAAVEDRIKGKVQYNYCIAKNDTEDALLTNDYQLFLQTVLTTLPPQSRLVFTLCRQQEKSYEEAAQILGVSSNAIKKHMVRSMKQFRFALAKDIGIAC